MITGIDVHNSMSGKDYGSALERATVAALIQAGIIVEAQAVAIQNAHVDTGRLKGSITYKVMKEGDRARSPATGSDEVSSPTDQWTVHVGSNVEYAQHIEYGTRRIPGGFPFLRPALQMKKGAILRDFDAWVSKGLKSG